MSVFMMKRCEGASGVDSIINGDVAVSVGSLTTVYGTGSLNGCGCANVGRHNGEKTGCACWHSGSGLCHVALIDWENQTVTQVITNGSYPYQPSNGHRFENNTCTFAIYPYEFDGDEGISLVYIAEV